MILCTNIKIHPWTIYMDTAMLLVQSLPTTDNWLNISGAGAASSQEHARERAARLHYQVQTIKVVFFKKLLENFHFLIAI